MSTLAKCRCPYRKPKAADWRRESVDSSLDERSRQIDLVRLDRAISVARCVGSRNPRAPASAQRPAAQLPQASDPQQHRPCVARWILWAGSGGGAGCPEALQAAGEAYCTLRCGALV